MRRNTNPSTLREMSGADGNFLRRLHPMSMDGVSMFDRKPKFLRESLMDGTKDKRKLLRIPNKCAISRLKKDLYVFPVLKFMGLYEVVDIGYVDRNHILHIPGGCLFNREPRVPRIYNRKFPLMKSLNYISRSYYHEGLYNMSTSKSKLMLRNMKCIIQ